LPHPFFFFFFSSRRRHTRWPRDWSSDVCLFRSRFNDAADLGAFSTPFGPQIGSRNITVTMGGVYRIPAMYAYTSCAYSNAVPMRSEERRVGKEGGFGGWGDQ